MLTLTELLHATAGRLEGARLGLIAREETLGRIVADSRDVEPGDIFWARVGPNHDGADFALQAFARGALGVVAQRPIAPPAGCWSICVRDTEWALWQVAAAICRRFTGHVIAVTGGEQRTTACQLVRAALGEQATRTAGPRHGRSRVDPRVSVLAWRPAQNHAVLDLEAGRPGEVDALAALCRPQIGVVIPAGPRRAEAPGRWQDVVQSKTELLAALPANGWAVVDGDDGWTRQLIHKCRARVVRTGQAETNDIVAADVEVRQGRLSFRVEGQAIDVPGCGPDDLTAALAAVAVGRVLERPLDVIAATLGKCTRPWPPIPVTAGQDATTPRSDIPRGEVQTTQAA